MLTIGIWVIAITLIVVNWEKLKPLVRRISIVVLLIILVAGGWFIYSRYWADLDWNKYGVTIGYLIVLSIIKFVQIKYPETINPKPSKRFVSEAEKAELKEKARQYQIQSRKNLGVIKGYPWYKRWWHVGMGTAYKDKELN